MVGTNVAVGVAVGVIVGSGMGVALFCGGIIVIVGVAAIGVSMALVGVGVAVISGTCNGWNATNVSRFSESAAPRIEWRAP